MYQVVKNEISRLLYVAMLADVLHRVKTLRVGTGVT